MDAADMRSPTAHTLEYFRKQGAEARTVEVWIQFPGMPHGKRRDLWGADVQVIQGRALIGIQATSGDNHSKRVNDAIQNPEVSAWLATGNLFEVWSWRKAGARGKRKVWTPRVTQLTLDGDGHVVEAANYVHIAERPRHMMD
jgi:hypothetical protein